MLTNTPAPAVVPAPVVAKEISTDGVTLPQFDASPINSRESVSPKEFKQEMVALSAQDSDGIFASPAAPTIPSSSPAPISSGSFMPQGSIGITSDVAPVGTIPTPPAPAPMEDREAILARLRGTASAPANTIATLRSDTYRETTEPTAAPMPSNPFRVSAPSFSNEETFPVPPIVPLTPPAPIAPPAPQPVEVAPAPLHTFTSDFADRVDQQRASTFSVLAAQSDSGVRAPTTISTQRRSGRSIWLPLAGGAIIILVGIGIAAGAYSYTHKTPTAPIVHGVPSIITFDESKEVSGAGPALAQSIVDVANGASVAGNIIVTYLSINSVPQEGGAVINALNTGAPDILLRNIDPASTVGVVSDSSGHAYPFMTLKVNSYERTFAGMLAWEPSMAKDLSTFYPQTSVTIVPAPTSTGSSTPIAITVPTTPYFSDAVVDNHDVRILRDAQGTSVMLYGYHNKGTLIIARNEADFTILVNRLDSSAQ